MVLQGMKENFQRARFDAREPPLPPLRNLIQLGTWRAQLLRRNNWHPTCEWPGTVGHRPGVKHRSSEPPAAEIRNAPVSVFT